MIFLIDAKVNGFASNKPMRLLIFHFFSGIGILLYDF